MNALFHEYKYEVVFGIVLTLVLGLSTWLSQFIPTDVFDTILTPASNVATVTIAFFGACVLFARSEGMLARKLFGVALLVWGVSDLLYLIFSYVAPMQIMNMGADDLTVYEVLLGNILGWVLTLYPTETLRPGWLSWKVVLWQLIPMIALVALDYIWSFNLVPIIALYPYLLLTFLLTHIRAYRIWCEENYSSMDDISVQWIVRYCIMLFLIGSNYIYMLSGHGHTRAFTQQWFVVFALAYSTEQIMFRRDPWANIPAESDEVTSEANPSDDICRLEQWMRETKPFLNPNFTLSDLRVVLPMNRTYISQLIHTTYNCTFYQFVTRYRIEEAKRLMLEDPNIKITDVAVKSGFSSIEVFSRIFLRETGVNPRFWNKKA